MPRYHSLSTVRNFDLPLDCLCTSMPCASCIVADFPDWSRIVLFELNLICAPFTGGSFTLFGSVKAGPFSVRIGDGTEEVREPETVTNGVLFTAEGLGSGAHRITLASAGDNTELRFQHVEFDAGVRRCE